MADPDKKKLRAKEKKRQRRRLEREIDQGGHHAKEKKRGKK